MRVIATLTTIPSRIDLIKPVLECILRQTIHVDHVELNVPEVCLRTGEPYVLPEWLGDMRKVEVYRTPDYGAITKIAPTLLRHRDEPDTLLWSVDDDILLPVNSLACLWKYYFPDQHAVLCNSGCLFVAGVPGVSYQTLRTYGRVDLIEGFGTILYPSGCIGDDFEEYVIMTSGNDDARKSDDVVLSNYFARRNVPMYTCGDPNQTIEYAKNLMTYYNLPDALHKQDDGHQVRYGRVLCWLKEKGVFGFAFTPKRHAVLPVKHKKLAPGHDHAVRYFRQARGIVLSGVSKDDDRVVSVPTLLRG